MKHHFLLFAIPTAAAILVAEILNAPETSHLIKEVAEHFGTQATTGNCRQVCRMSPETFHDHTCTFVCDRIHSLMKQYVYVTPTAIPTAAPTPRPTLPGPT